MNGIARYASLVKFTHTIFALPFALIGYFYALTDTEAPFAWLIFVQVLMCMIFARNTAMGFNRYADREVDACNPRTAGREIPSGVISARRALWFVIINALLFVAVARWINPLTGYLSPLALLILIGYSYTKRFTAWCHIVLGVALGIAPVGAYIAVTGSIAIVPILLAALVMSWVSGFDIIYALQDETFDRENGLHSVPARWGIKGAIGISVLLHLVTVYAVWVLGIYSGGGTLYWVGAAVFIALLVFQHLLVTPKNISRIGLAFGTLNGIASLCYATFVIADFYTK